MSQSIVINSLGPIMDQLYKIGHQGFEEAKTDRFWEEADPSYRAKRINMVTTLLLEKAFKQFPSVATSRRYGSFRFAIGSVIGRYKKIGRKGLPQNVQTFRNRQFESGQISLLDRLFQTISVNESPIPVSICYWTDKLFTKITAIEVVCQSQGFRFEIAEPTPVIKKMADHYQQPKREVKTKPKENKRKHGRRKEDE